MINKTFKHKFLVGSSIVLIVLISIVYLLSNTNGKLHKWRDALNKNKIEITTSKNLNINNVNVFWNSEKGPFGQIVKNGKVTDFVFKEYGINTITLLYNKDTIKIVSYIKTANWQGVKHFIELKKDEQNNVVGDIKIVKN